MKTNSITILSALLLASSLHAQNPSPVQVGNLTTEHLTNPIGIGVTQPRLSWKLHSPRQGEAQTAYEVRAATTAAGLNSATPDLWDSGKVASDQSVLVPWSGKTLGSRAEAFWQVRVWDKGGQPSAWSAPATFELGLLDAPTEWKGQWITSDLPRYDIDKVAFAKAYWINAGSDSTQPAAVRTMIELPAGVNVRSATVDINADGLATLYVNGQPNRQGSSSHTAPLHMEFGTELKPGKNLIAIGAIPVRLSRGGGRNAIAAHGVIELDNGQRVEFNTDGTWKATIPPLDAPARGGFGFGGAAAPAPATPAGPKWYDVAYDDSAWPAATALEEYNVQPASGSADSTIGPGRYLRKTFTVKGPVAKARLYSTALGAYEASLNGQPVNDHQLDPGWTDYYKRVMMQATDVTALLKPGQNVLGALLGDGWFAGRVGWMGLYQYSNLGKIPMFSAQLEITYADGARDVIVSDNTWKTGAGEVVGADQQFGEVLDARAAAPWGQPSFDDSAWANATVGSLAQPVALVPEVGVPVRKLLELAPKKITRLGGVWIVDLGQNMVGHVRLIAHGPANTTIQLRHGEMLNRDGTLYTENLRPAISLDTFILKGSPGKETFEPHFTFHGFRYVEITGYPGELTADDVRGIVVGSDSPATGTFESSSQDLNQLYSNIIWGQRGNFLSVPTDCPQRDERMGWMGDAQVFAPTAARNADVAAFFTKWLTDVDDTQRDNGAYSTVAPRANQADAYPVWGDAGVIIPWTMYQVYGDKTFLANSYPYMARWMVHEVESSDSLVLTGGVGDHLAVRPTPTQIVDTAYFANSARIVARAAAILGRTEDAAAYEKLHDNIVAAFNTNFVGEDGSITAPGGFGRGFGPAPAAGAAPARSGNTQAAYVMALRFDLLPEKLRPLVAQRLVDDIQQTGHLSTGFVGSGLLCPVLTQIGRSDLAWQLLFTDTYPSWLYHIRMGATTIWEHWDGWTENGTASSTMNSFNHYSFGAVGYWFYSGAGGIMLDESSPGYKHFLLQPQVSGRLANLQATFDSPYGVIASAWRVDNGQVSYDCTVPPNSSAQLTLPAAPANVKQTNLAAGETPLRATGDAAASFDLPAGAYHFAFPLPKPAN